MHHCRFLLLLLLLLAVGCGKSAPLADYPARAQAAADNLTNLIGGKGDAAALDASQQEFQKLVGDYRGTAVAQTASFKEAEALAPSFAVLKAVNANPDAASDQQAEQVEMIFIRVERMHTALAKEKSSPTP